MSVDEFMDLVIAYGVECLCMDEDQAETYRAIRAAYVHARFGEDAPDA